MKLLEMSISAGVLVFFLMLLRTLVFSKLPKQVFVLCWMIVLVRLFVPGSLPLPKGIASPAVCLLQQVIHLAGQGRHTAQKYLSAPVVQEAASSRTVDGAKYNCMDLNVDILHVLCSLWIVGVVVCGIYFIHHFRREQRFLAQAIPLRCIPQASICSPAHAADRNDRLQKQERLQELYTSVSRVVGIRTKAGKKEPILTHDRLSSPLVRGIFGQQIVIPKEMLHMENIPMKYVLAHEMVHIRRWDNFRKFISAAAVCIHWFNPAVWAMYFLLARDMELSCDEQVLALYGREKRETYAMTLLTLAQNQRETILFSSGFGKNLTKERIVAIMKYKKLSKTGAVCAVMMLAGAVTIFAANDEAAASEGKTEQIEADANHVSNVVDQGKDQDTQLTEGDDVSYTLVEVSEDGGERKVLKTGEMEGSNEEELRKAAEQAVKEAKNADGKSENSESQAGLNVEMLVALDGDGKEVVSEKYYFFGEDGEEKEINLKDGESTLTVDGKQYHIELEKDKNTVNVEVEDEK